MKERSGISKKWTMLSRGGFVFDPEVEMCG